MAHSVFHPSEADIVAEPAGPAAPEKLDITFTLGGSPADARTGHAHGVACPVGRKARHCAASP
eukprot:13289325-Heterocapsa_arctica.AAC.1